MARPRGFATKDHAASRRLVQAAQRGDRRAEDELVRRYEPLVQHAVSRLRLPPWCEREDLAQEARLGLVKAMREWRPERGAFPAFAQRCVKNQALLAVISASRHKHVTKQSSYCAPPPPPFPARPSRPFAGYQEATYSRFKTSLRL